MVIISKDDFLSFMNDIGGKMQTPPASVNSSLSNVSTATIQGSACINKFYGEDEDGSLSPQMKQHIDRLREVMLESKAAAANGNSANSAGGRVLQTARAVLICRPNSHPFLNRTLFLEPNVEIKIGRSVARTKVSETNAIFDCKVLSRNHAVIWYADGKFFLKDTGSSNGTFINNNRLSPTTVQSEPFEVSSGDIVQFGVDVMENSRKETHGCIVATLKLFLPDGRETKASHSTLVGAVSQNIEPSDLYRLNQYVQEIVQRDQIMETKLMSIQKTVDNTRKNSQQSWQALIDEDRLLSRIDMLEKKLQCMQKNVSDDKLREELVKMHEDKLQYETKAKEQLHKISQDRADAVQHLNAIQRALCSSEDECSLLRELVAKLNQEIQDLTEKFSTVQKQFDEKLNEAQDKESKKEIEIKGLKDDVKILQERVVLLQENCDSDDSNDSMKVNLGKNNKEKEKMEIILENSNIMDMQDSMDIINSICNENDYEVTDENSSILDPATAKIYKKLLNLEQIVNRIEESYPRRSSQASDSNVENSQTDENNSTSVCDGNQNLSYSAVLAATTDAKLLKKSIKTLKNSFIDLMKAYNRTNIDQNETKTEERKEGDEETTEQEQSEKLERLEKLKSELEARPTVSDYKEKIDLIDELNDKLTLSETENLAFKLELKNNMTKMESLQQELKEVKENQKEHTTKVTKTDAVVQTLVPQVMSSSNNNNKKLKYTEEDNVPCVASTSTAGGSGVEDMTHDESQNASAITQELNIIHHPDVQREEELVLFKEKYTKLVEEKLLIDKELASLREDFQQYRNKSLTQLLMYLAPIFALIAYLFIHYCCK